MNAIGLRVLGGLLSCVLLFAVGCDNKKITGSGPSPSEQPPSWAIDVPSPKCFDSIWVQLFDSQGSALKPAEVIRMQRDSGVVWRYQFSPVSDPGPFVLAVRRGPDQTIDTTETPFCGTYNRDQISKGLALSPLAEGVELDFRSLPGPETYPMLASGEDPLVGIEEISGSGPGSHWLIPLEDGGRRRRVVVEAIYPGSYRFCILSGTKPVPMGKFIIPASLPPSSVVHVEGVEE